MAKPPADSTIRRVIDHLTEAGALDEHGLHADADCEREAAQVEEELAVVIGELHRQAHPGESRLVMGCRLEPCRSLPLTDYPSVAIA
jgi:hypothetical protein